MSSPMVPDDMQATFQSQTIEWSFPPPRKGALGAWDRFVGPGYASGELRLWIFATAAGCLLAVAYPLVCSARWNWWQYLIAGVIGADIWGGVAVNASAPAKRWYHRKNASVLSHVAFVAVHAVHVLVVATIFHPNPLAYFMVFTGALGASTLAVLAAPLYLRRPVAALAAAASISVLAAGPGLTPFLQWFEPAMFMKLVIGYLVFEAPFRPRQLEDLADS
jgi:hypothetical protein